MHETTRGFALWACFAAAAALVTAQSLADDRAALSLAIRQGHLAAVRAIVEKHPALVKSGDDSGFTPLHIAATAGRVEIVEYLLGRGADLEARTAGGQTPLFHTVPLASQQVFAYLLKKGANLNARDNRGQTILQFALTWRRPAMADLILQYGFIVDAGDAAAQAMLDEAANTGIESLVTTLILRGVAVEPGTRNGTTLLHSAARGGLPGLADRVLKLGARPNERDRHGLTALHLAAVYGRDAVVPVLLAAGADIEASYAGGGRQLFFSSNRPRQKGGPPKRDMDVWMVERAGEAWGEPTNLGPAVNGESNEYMPSADREGNLYFERYGLNVARWRNGAYLPATQVEIAGAVNPGHPFVAPDGSYLLFDARPSGAGAATQYGVLFVAFRLKGGNWSLAVRLFESPGTRDYENCPTVSPDGKYLFFGRDDDIYWVSAEVIDARRPGGL